MVQKELQEFVDASFFLAEKLKDIPGASDALIDYSKKLAKLIVKQAQPRIATNVHYCEDYYSKHQNNT